MSHPIGTGIEIEIEKEMGGGHHLEIEIEGRQKKEDWKKEEEF